MWLGLSRPQQVGPRSGSGASREDSVIWHERENPYPQKTSVGTVLDERCVCEHFRSDHHDAESYGEGSCGADCSCARFTWKTYILRTALYRE
jgi:hypothetical protein